VASVQYVNNNILYSLKSARGSKIVLKMATAAGVLNLSSCRVAGLHSRPSIVARFGIYLGASPVPVFEKLGITHSLR